jgi:glycosyltransferase involved in cell wall biosynthesis
MKLFYIANSRIPTEKAHGIQIMSMCHAFSLAGHEVTLILPRRRNSIKGNAFEYYEIKNNFKILYLPTFDLVGFGKVGFWIELTTFSVSVLFYLLFKKGSFYYTRDEWIVALLSFFGKEVVWETHTKKSNFLTKYALSKSQKIITLTGASKDYYKQNFFVPNEKILVSPDGVDLEKFSRVQGVEELKKQLKIDSGVKVVGYIGKYKTMAETKGVDGLISAFAQVLVEVPGSVLLIVGLNDDEFTEVRKFCEDSDIFEEHRVLVGHVRFADIPTYMKICDVLVMNYPNTDHYARFMSPLKLFEYMASGVPVVSSDLPSIREVLRRDNSVLVSPDSPGSLAVGIKSILTDKVLADTLAKEALSEAEEYSWLKRAERIISSLGF